MRLQNRWLRRGRADTEEGQRRAQIIRENLERAGERLTVTTSAIGGNSAFVRQIVFLPQPISPSTLTRLQLEGVISVGTAMTMDFVCAGNTQVATGDLIGLYDGATWQTLGTPLERYAGVTLLRHVIAQRTS